MNAIPSNFPMPADTALAASAASAKWAALQDAASVVAMLAGVGIEPQRQEIRDFTATIGETGGWRLRLAEQGIDDLAAIMQPGIEALLAVHARGADAKAPAIALWREFEAGREALLALVPRH